VSPTRKQLLYVLLLVCLVSFYMAGCVNSVSDENNNPHITIEGSGVKNEILITLEELKNMHDEIIEENYFSLNTYGTEEDFHFKGVWVWGLLQKKASLQEEATIVSFIAEDGYTVQYTLEDVRRDNYINEKDPAKKYKIILAWEENNTEYDPKEGSPFRLVVGQKEPGDINKPFWVRNVIKIKID
jgi:DMSO/TMAO reductase YedYZ molybdopterin-dependent catalytic subunit